MKIATLLLIILCLLGCSNERTYKGSLRQAKYKVGETVVIDKGFYKGCHVKITSIEPNHTDTMYYGTSECPIKGFYDEGTIK